MAGWGNRSPVDLGARSAQNRDASDDLRSRHRALTFEVCKIHGKRRYSVNCNTL